MGEDDCTSNKSGDRRDIRNIGMSLIVISITLSMIGASLGEVIRVIGFVVTQLKLYSASILFSVVVIVVVI